MANEQQKTPMDDKEITFILLLERLTETFKKETSFYKDNQVTFKELLDKSLEFIQVSHAIKTISTPETELENLAQQQNN